MAIDQNLLRLLAGAAPDALAVAEKVLLTHAAEGGEVNQTVRLMAEQGLLSKGAELGVNVARAAQGKPLLQPVVTLPKLCERLDNAINTLATIIDQLNSIGFALTGEPFSDKVYRVLDEMYPPTPEPPKVPDAAEPVMPGSLSHLKFLVERYESQVRYLNAFQSLCSRLVHPENQAQIASAVAHR